MKYRQTDGRTDFFAKKRTRTYLKKIFIRKLQKQIKEKESKKRNIFKQTSYTTQPNQI